MRSSSRLRTQSCHMLVVLSILLASVPAPTHAATPPTQPTAAHQAATGIPLRSPLAYRPPSASVPLGDLFPAPQAVLPAFDSPLPTPEPPGEETAEPDVSPATLDSPLSTPLPPTPALPSVSASPLALAAVAEPEGVLPGAVVTLTLALSNTGAVAVGGLAVQATLPDGLQWMPGQPGWAYDESTRRLSAEVGDLAPGTDVALAVCLRTGEQIAGPLALTWEAQSGEVVLASVRVPVWVARRVQATIGPDGGTLQSGDGRVRLEFPAGAVSRAAAVTLTAYLAHTPGTPIERAAHPKQGLLRFEIEATEATDGAPIAALDRPVQIVVDMRQLLPDSTGQGWYVAYRDPQDAGVWYGVETHVLDEAGLIGVTTDHFSAWSAGAENVGWRFVWQEPTVGTFSGAATYGYPIEVPPGRAGLQPNVDISYSSRGVDGQTSCNMDQGPIGLGWSINDVEIAREGVHLKDRYGHVGLIHPDAFSLVLDGAGYELLTNESTANAVVRYYVTNAPQLFVERRYDSSASDSNPDRIYWIVKTPEGTVYRLGRTSDSASGQSMGYSLIDTTGTQHEGYSTSYSGIRWLVDTVTDVYGNQVQYTYATWTEQNSYDSHTQDDQGQSHTTSSTTYHSRIRSIRYNYTTRATDAYTRVSGTYATLVDLIHTADHRIDQIKLYHVNLSQPYRMVDLGLGTVWQDCGESMKTDTLNSITEFDGSGTASLPAVTLSYVTLAHAWGNCYEYEHLQQVDNGYGGRVRFTYGAGDGRVSDGWQCGCVPEYGNTFVATQKETWDGLGAQPAVVEYAFTKPCYDQYDGDVGDLAGAFNCPTRNDFSGYGHGGLVGFAVVTETARGYQGETLSRQTTWFSQTRQLMGRLGLEKSFDAGGSLLRSVETRHVTATVGPTTFSYGSPVTTTDYGGGVSASHVVSYTYDTYGNLTAVYDYGGSAAGDERSVHYTYNPTTTVWIVNRLGRETVYEGIRTDDTTDANLAYRRSRTRYTYDGQACWTAPPLKGAVTAVDHWNGTSGGSPGDCWAANFSMVSRAGYDEWGNRISETSPRLYTTTMAYDGLYHLYPMQVCNALGQCRHTDYYGLGGIAADYGRPGQVKRTVDPNGAVTEYRYDAFGRLTAVKAPDDTGWSVQQATRYVEYQYMGQVGQQRIVAYSGRNATWQEEYLDGLGRTVQVHQNAWSGQEIRATTQYDGLGRAMTAWTPYTGTHGENGGYGAYGYVPPAGGLPRTSTEYDGLGRTVRVVNPDSTTVQSAYVGWTAVVTDANGHRVARTSDGLGRLVRVEEYTGTVGSSPLLYATTRYGYDVLDHLTAVTDTLSNLITTTYDTLGHKTAMRDPDMGTWQYRYDAAGNLIKQRDARKQAICFYYDALERPVGKTYHNNPLDFEAPGLCSGTYAVTYTYEGGGSATYVSHGERIIHGGGGKAYVSVGSVSTDTTFTLNVPAAGMHSLSIVLHQDTNVTNPGIYSSTVQVYLDGSSLGTINVTGGAGPALQEYAGWMVGSASVGVFQVNVSAGAHTLRLRRTGGQGWEEIAQDGSEIVLDYSAGQRTAMVVPNVDTSAWRYDVRGRVVREVRTIAGGGTFTTSYAYNALDRMVATTYPDGEVVSTTYSAAGWPVQVRSATHSLNYASGVTYNALGQVTALPLGNTLTTNYTYEARTFRLQRIQTGSLFDLRYGYDAVGNVTAITDTVAGNQVQTFGYDALERLASARATGGSVLTYTHVYSYNQIGNMMVATGLGAYGYGATASGCATGTVSVKPHAVTQAGSNSYVYDCNGNVTRRVELSGTQVMTYYQEYDAENRLVAVTNTVTSLVTRFAYDGDGRRVKVTAGTTTTLYVGTYYEQQGSTVTRYYYLGGQRVAMRVGPAGQAGTLTYLHGDHLGSTSLATNSSGGVVARQRYYPYGAVRPGGTGTLPTGYTFTGQKDVPGTGLMYYGARYYEPYLNRWIQPDTIVPDPANPQSLNRYSYVYNRPLVYMDSSGRFPIIPPLIAGGIIVGAAVGLAVVPHLLPNDPPVMINGPRVAPPTSSNMTAWLRNQMVTNAQSPVVQSIRENWASRNPLRKDAALQAWTSLVGTDAIWDLKPDILQARQFVGDTADVVLGNRQLNFDAVANMHYGFVGRGAGLDDDLLVAAAGLAQEMRWRQTDDPRDKGVCNTSYYCDHPYATWSVRFGSYLYDLYKDRLGELDDAAFTAALEEYIRIYGEPPAPPSGAVAP